MKEITAEFLRAFINANNIPLVATQTKLCIPIIYRMCQKMSYGIKFDEIKVSDDLIIDGHHRYLSALIMNLELNKIESNATSATKPVAWNKIEFDTQDWDTPAKIKYLNELDAKYNGLEKAFVEQIIAN